MLPACGLPCWRKVSSVYIKWCSGHCSQNPHRPHNEGADDQEEDEQRPFWQLGKRSFFFFSFLFWAEFKQAFYLVTSWLPLFESLKSFWVNKQKVRRLVVVVVVAVVLSLATANADVADVADCVAAFGLCFFMDAFLFIDNDYIGVYVLRFFGWKNIKAKYLYARRETRQLPATSYPNGRANWRTDRRAVPFQLHPPCASLSLSIPHSLHIPVLLLQFLYTMRSRL